jgi:hypothetical protein
MSLRVLSMQIQLLFCWNAAQNASLTTKSKLKSFESPQVARCTGDPLGEESYEAQLSTFIRTDFQSQSQSPREAG